MKLLLRQAVGIDVAQNELVVALGRMDEAFLVDIYAHKTFSNSASGFEGLVDWVSSRTEPGIGLRFVMEATGVYHEQLAHFLAGKGLEVSVVVPNKISNFFRTLEVKTVTDKTASETLTRFGLERKLDSWKPPHSLYRRIRHLTRERDQVIADRTVAKNQLHAELAGFEPLASSVKRINQKIALLDKQVKEITTELMALVKRDEEIYRQVRLMSSLPGIGLLTAATILGETNGFELIRNKRQLTSYAGLDVREKQSGTSIRSKPTISKKGNSYLRKAMHLPALAAIRTDERFKAIFTRLVGKHGIKMKAVVAVQRKLLEMTYVLFKHNSTYDKSYLHNSPLPQETL
ncbi:IS110 family transposase [Flavihumibacter stibioxidans]|uniref:Transposase n=1 Tax=Flavihumibacter stibioxidans TaxID=1834163 RepID=A0ABR7MCH3_9BACT|nr:IS110 family transposase [Flavihumibacter stibioxidans]MBC6492738.1 transposase [Flavihumibacter stibioxidans]